MYKFFIAFCKDVSQIGFSNRYNNKRSILLSIVVRNLDIRIGLVYLLIFKSIYLY